MTNSADNYEQWTRSIRASDDRAFDCLFRALYEPLVRFAMKYTHSKATSCDIVQDIFVNLWQQRENLDPELSIQSLLYTSVRNRCLNYLRDHQKETVGLEEEFVGETLKPDEENNSENHRKMDRLLDWIEALPERQKEAITLSRFEGLDHEEIAHVMLISVRTVNNHIVQALQTLREKEQSRAHSTRIIRHG